jgi:hypothetical protein
MGERKVFQSGLVRKLIALQTAPGEIIERLRCASADFSEIIYLTRETWGVD